MRGVWCQALSLPRPPVPWGGQPGYRDPCVPGAVGAGVGTRHRFHSVRPGGPALLAVAEAEGRPRGGGAFHRCEGRLRSGAPPPLTARPLGRPLASATHMLWARVCGCGGPTLSPWPACPVGAACRGGGGGPSSGRVACQRCEGRLVSGAVPPPAARPLGRAAGVPVPVCPGCGRCGCGDPAPAPRRAPLRAGVARRGDGGRASPGGRPSAVVRGVWGQVLPLPRLRALWAGCRGPLPTGCGCGGVRAWGPITNPTASALASWLRALWGRHEGAWGGRLLPGCGPSGVGRSPTPNCPPSGRAVGAHYPLALGAGGCGRGDPSPTPQRALACCGGGMRVPGGGASCLGVGRLGSGALPPPTARRLGGLPGPTTHWLWVRGRAGVGTRHQPHSARSCELAMRAVGAARGRPGGAPPAWVSGVRGRALSHLKLPAPWAGCRGPLRTGCGCEGVRAWGPVTNPTAHSPACCGGGMRVPGGGASCLGVGHPGSGALPPPTARPLGRLPGPTTHRLWVRGGCGRGDPAPTPQRALLRAGFARCGGGMRVPGGGASCLGVGRLGSGALPPPTALPLGGLPVPTTHWLWVRGGGGVGTRHQPHSARSCVLWGRHVGAQGGRLLTGCGASGLGRSPTPPARPLGGLPEPTTHWLRVRGGAGGCGRGDPSPTPQRALLRAGFARCGGGTRAPGGGRLRPGCGASGVGRSPTPDCPPSGRAAGAYYPLAVGAGGCGRGDPSPTPQCALLRAGFARCGGGTRMPGGGASCLGVGRPGSAALPPPTARPLGGLPGPTTHWLWVWGVAGVGTRHRPHSALALPAVGHEGARGGPLLPGCGASGVGRSPTPDCLPSGRAAGAHYPLAVGVGGCWRGDPSPTPQRAGFARRGGGMRVPGGGASCVDVGRPGSGALPPPTARPLGGLPGHTTHWLWVREMRVWGPVTNHTARWLCALWGRHEGARGGRLLPGCGASGSGALPPPTARPLGGLPGPASHWLWVRGGAGVGTRPQPHSARTLARCGGGTKAPGGAPPAWVWGFRGRALSQPRLPALWAGCRGLLPTGCGCGGVRASGPFTNPTARALASWLCTLWGRHEDAPGGRLLPGCAASGVGRSPTPDCPPSGRAAGAHYPLAVGVGGCGRGDPSPTPQRAGFARCGGGMRVPGGGASCLGVGRPGSGALPAPTARPLGGLPGPTTHWLWVREGAGVETRHQPHSARSCELALRAVGAARGRPGGAPPAWLWGVRGRALSHPRLPALWAGCWGPLPTGCGCGGGAGVGTHHQPHSARSCELAMRAEGAAQGRPGGAPPAWVWGVRGRALSHPRLPALWAGCRGPLPTGCGCGGVRVWGPVTNPTARRLCALLGRHVGARGGRLLPGCRGVRGRALSHPRLPALSAGCRGPIPTGCGCGGVRAWGPVTNPTARALASWLCALWGRHEGARGGAPPA